MLLTNIQIFFIIIKYNLSFTINIIISLNQQYKKALNLHILRKAKILHYDIITLMLGSVQMLLLIVYKIK